MSNLFLFLFLLSFIGIIVGLINPKLLKMKGRLQALGLTILATVVFFILFGVTSDLEEETVQTDEEVNTEEVAEAENTEEDKVVEKDTEKVTDDETEQEEAIEEPIDEEPLEETTVEEETKIENVETPEETLSQKNAVNKAIDYLAYTAFSKSGLIEQLKYEGFDDADANYAVSQISVDWQEQAVLMAQDYLDYTSFSKSGLIEQLVHEGFSNEDATYAAGQVGF